MNGTNDTRGAHCFIKFGRIPLPDRIADGLPVGGHLQQLQGPIEKVRVHPGDRDEAVVLCREDSERERVSKRERRLVPVTVYRRNKRKVLRDGVVGWDLTRHSSLTHDERHQGIHVVHGFAQVNL
ncbi:hypothetical protein [Variovorax davisae]|uniref:hypothetical protein n=1 Tax=Variovorax davisae TaxID=3053515 RepID=UPI0025770517|nr:hypothetical protein [Variovorax sp. J22P271]